jgi:hypothetical protein
MATCFDQLYDDSGSLENIKLKITIANFVEGQIKVPGLQLHNA